MFDVVHRTRSDWCEAFQVAKRDASTLGMSQANGFAERRYVVLDVTSASIEIVVLFFVSLLTTMLRAERSWCI